MEQPAAQTANGKPRFGKTESHCSLLSLATPSTRQENKAWNSDHGPSSSQASRQSNRLLQQIHTFAAIPQPPDFSHETFKHLALPIPASLACLLASQYTPSPIRDSRHRDPHRRPGSSPAQQVSFSRAPSPSTEVDSDSAAPTAPARLLFGLR